MYCLYGVFILTITGKSSNSYEITEIDDFLEYCKTFPKYDDAILEYGNRVLDYELEGKIAVENNVIKII